MLFTPQWSTGALFEAATRNPVCSDRLWDLCLTCRDSTATSPGCQAPRWDRQLRKGLHFLGWALCFCSWWNRRHGWEEERGVCQRGDPSAILRCHPDTCRNYKRKTMTATHTTQHSQPCTMSTTSHKVRAALAIPSHPLEEPVCPHGKAEILVLWWLKSIMESQALRQVASPVWHLGNHLCTRRAWGASETFSSCSAIP